MTLKVRQTADTFNSHTRPWVIVPSAKPVDRFEPPHLKSLQSCGIMKSKSEVFEIKNKELLNASIKRTVFVAFEILALAIFSIIVFSNDGSPPWGYWGNVLIPFLVFSPIIVYIIASTIFNTYNMITVVNGRHTFQSIQIYNKTSNIFLVWGVITGAVYGFIFVPFFLLENHSLTKAYKKELDKIQYEQYRLRAEYYNVQNVNQAPPSPPTN